jgi:hypothetical protein
LRDTLTKAITLGQSCAKGAENRVLIAKATTPEQIAAIGNQGAGRVWLILETDNFA